MIPPRFSRRLARRHFLAQTAGLAVPLAIASPSVLAQGPDPSVVVSMDSLVPLFNGRNLEGWTPVNVARNTFTVRDGIIVSTGIPTGVMRTNRHYQNFILELEWRHMRPGGNAGLFVYSDPIPSVGVPFTRSVEIQIIDGNSSDGIWTGHGDIFSIHGARMIPDRPHPRGWERCLPSENRARPAGEWNHYRVESREGRVTLAVNGKVVSGAFRCVPRRGYICLESEGSECHFRNLRIQELPSHLPSANDEIAKLDEGFASVYTGIDLEEWKVSDAHRNHWVAKDWTLHADGQGPSELWLRHRKARFDFQCDWRSESPGVSAALLVNGKALSEIQLHSDGKKWNRIGVSVQGGDVRYEANGGAATIQFGGANRPVLGRIALVHRGSPVQFANLFIRS